MSMSGSKCEHHAAAAHPSPRVSEYRETLNRFFGTEFQLWDAEAGQRLATAEIAPLDDQLWLPEMVRAVARQGQPQFVAETDWVLILAVPIRADDATRWVATAPFVIRRCGAGDAPQESARLLGLNQHEAVPWINQQNLWAADQLLLMAEAVQGKLEAEASVGRMENEVELISQNLATTYEEISLLYTVTQNLRISSTDEELGRQALDWLIDCVPAKAFAIQYLPVRNKHDSTYKARQRSVLISRGECPITNDQFTELVGRLDVNASAGPFVGNRRVTAAESWLLPQVRQLIVAPLAEGENVFGWLAAFNHQQDEEFGTVEANLLSSLGALLGIHCGNLELYRQQSELVANVVRALVSAIDAKDQYTSGHSDRVARFAVRIALEMRCDPKLLNTIYMAGLLHDVGKIGIDDNVLRKAGRLTEAEFEHIKLHPEMGTRILADIRQLSDVLPAVLHHHEQWDGQGYPKRLAAEQIPLMARIMAVADAYDAMTSDRPYRAGMPDEKVDDIFRRGSGVYWDPAVVEAYFSAKRDIEAIRRRERSAAEPTMEHWV